VGGGEEQQEILVGDNHRGSMGEIEHETERGSVWETGRVADL